MPSKFVLGDGTAVVPASAWTTGSGAPLERATGYLCCGCSFFVSGDGAGAGAMSRSGSDVS